MSHKSTEKGSETGQTKVAVATRNPRALYNAVKLLKSLGLGFNICNPGDTECSVANVVITTEDEQWPVGDDRVVRVGRDPDPDIAAIEIKMRLLRIKRPSVVAIGVDPGMRIGLAITMDGIPVHTKALSSPIGAAHDTLVWLVHITAKYPQSETVLRIGTGSPLYTALYLRGVVNKAGGTAIELVDEHHTTIAAGAGSDQSSATIIASRHGRAPSKSDLTLEPNEEYVKSLKRLVARMTDGKRSLTTVKARLVLAGNLSLDGILDDSG
jgi:hypothetical protein